MSRKAREMYEKLLDQGVLDIHENLISWWQKINSPFIEIKPKEDNMSMEKRAVVETPAEKTAHKRIKKDLEKPKPNQQPKPPTPKKKAE